MSSLSTQAPIFARPDGTKLAAKIGASLPALALDALQVCKATAPGLTVQRAEYDFNAADLDHLRENSLAHCRITLRPASRKLGLTAVPLTRKAEVPAEFRDGQ